MMLPSFIVALNQQQGWFLHLLITHTPMCAVGGAGHRAHRPGHGAHHAGEAGLRVLRPGHGSRRAGEAGHSFLRPGHGARLPGEASRRGAVPEADRIRVARAAQPAFSGLVSAQGHEPSLHKFHWAPISPQIRCWGFRQQRSDSCAVPPLSPTPVLCVWPALFSNLPFRVFCYHC